MRCAFLFFLLLSALPVSAGTIRWTQTLSTKVDSRGLTCLLTMEHKGDEVAREVEVDFEFADQSATRRLAAEAVPGSTLAMEPLTFIKPSKPGWYPVIAKIRYADLNGYPFSSLIVNLQKIDTPPELLLAMKPIGIEIAGSGSGAIPVGWRGGAPIEMKARLAVPEELRARAPAGRIPITLEPRTTASIPVTLEAGDALVGAKYVGYLILEGEDAAFHYTGLGVISISVTDAAGAKESWRWIALAVLIAAVGVLLWPLLKRRRG